MFSNIDLLFVSGASEEVSWSVGAIRILNYFITRSVSCDQPQVHLSIGDNAPITSLIGPKGTRIFSLYFSLQSLETCAKLYKMFDKKNIRIISNAAFLTLS